MFLFFPVDSSRESVTENIFFWKNASSNPPIKDLEYVLLLYLFFVNESEMDILHVSLKMDILSASVFFTAFMVEGSFYFFSCVLVQVSR